MRERAEDSELPGRTSKAFGEGGAGRYGLATPWKVLRLWNQMVSPGLERQPLFY